MTTEADLTEQIARALWDHDMFEESPEWRDMAWVDMGGSEHTQERIDYELAAAAVLPIIRKAQADALRETARYFAAGLHCADMRTTPEETVRALTRRADGIEREQTDD